MTPVAWLITETRQRRDGSWTASRVLYGHMFINREPAEAAAERMTSVWRKCAAIPVYSAEEKP